MFWTEAAWLSIGDRPAWADNVLLTAGDDGTWTAIEAGVPRPADATILDGPVLPGMVNAHSHAFQRAFAGLAEHRHAGRDDFWTWRDRMYAVALRITPAQMQAVAAHLYGELLQGGYTQVCEFHYLHNQPDGTPYDDPLTLTWPLIQAAERAGIGITMIPVVYERAGFDQPTLRDDQRRFRLGAQEAWHMHLAVVALKRDGIRSAIGVHSLRAATPESLRELLELSHRFDGPIHLHIAEQTGEVESCVKATGMRPLEWLASEKLLDARMRFTHATHTTARELDAVAAAGAGVILCPTTEANLGDGICDLPGLLRRGILIAMGSDSQVGRSWTDELRLAESVQRLKARQRCIGCNPRTGHASVGEMLVARALAGGVAAEGGPNWGLRAWSRADFLVADETLLAGVPRPHWLDTLVFATQAPPWREVYVAGRRVVKDFKAVCRDETQAGFAGAMRELWMQ